MSELPAIYQLLATVIPITISAIVAIVTNKEINECKAEVAKAQVRIKALETTLLDYGLPLPPEVRRLK